jgi:hypothetical protein
MDALALARDFHRGAIVHQRADTQPIGVKLAVCSSFQNALSHYRSARSRLLVRRQAGPGVVQCGPQECDGLGVEVHRDAQILLGSKADLLQ